MVRRVLDGSCTDPSVIPQLRAALCSSKEDRPTDSLATGGSFPEALDAVDEDIAFFSKDGGPQIRQLALQLLPRIHPCERLWELTSVINFASITALFSVQAWLKRWLLDLSTRFNGPCS